MKAPTAAAVLIALALCGGCTTRGFLPGGYRDAPLGRAEDERALEAMPRAADGPRDSAPMQDLTLEHARALALTRNHTARAAAAAVEAAEAQMSEARAAFLPTLSATIRRTDYDKVRTVDFGPGGTIDISPTAVTEGSARLAFSLFSFGRDVENWKAAQARYAGQVLDERSALQELLRRTSQSWYAIHEASAQVEVAQDALAAAERQHADARNLVEAGKATRDAELTAEVEALRRRQELTVARNALLHARRVLNALLVRELDAPLQLADPPPFEPASVDAREILALALDFNPALLRYRADRLALEHTREAVERSFLPEFTGAIESTYTSFTGFGGFPVNTTASIAATWVPVDAGRRAGRLNEIHANLVRLRELELAAMHETELDIQRTLLDLEEARSALELGARSVAAAEENRRIITERFRGGETTAREVLEADASLTSARFQYNRARFAYSMLLANLEALAGVDQADWNRKEESRE